MRGICLAPVLVLGLVVATAPAQGPASTAGAEATTPTRTRLVPLEVEPASAPADGRSGDFEGRPGRDNPEEFYKKPPRKPKQKSRMHA
ncbi:hypothetical protein [Vulgatibacter sp.]|uniref:hypothetical protein n=1 Tax=Vulgatibacter sp. TaxID=1971226 RepID=UPI0035653417